MFSVLARLFRFNGRIGRRRYWTGTLLYLLSGILGAVLLVALAALNDNPPADTIAGRSIVGLVLLVITVTVFVCTIVAGLASTGVRRLHDRGKSGWWLVLYYLVPDKLLTEGSFWHGGALIIPMAAGAILIWGLVDLGILRSQAGSNAYGPDPLIGKS